MADLSGITIVSVEQAVAAPYAAARLADAGARVIKVERPEGDFARDYDQLVQGQSAYFVWLNRGKQSVCLDLRKKDDARVLKNMIGEADVFIQNLKPGSLDKMGFAPAELRRAYPRLICCSISGFGTEGPRAHLKAYDLIVQAETGLCSITGTEQGPARVGVSLCDIAAGMNAHTAILQALFARAQSGEGALIEISLFDALAEWMNVPYLQHVYGDHNNQRMGVNHASLAPYGAYQCGDEISLIFSVQNQREWVTFCRVFLGQPELADHADYATNMARLAHRGALDDIINARFAGLSSEEASALLEESALAYGRLNTVADLASHPHLTRAPLDTPAGPIEIVAPAARINHARPALGPVPEKDQHGAQLRKEFGD